MNSIAQLCICSLLEILFVQTGSTIKRINPVPIAQQPERFSFAESKTKLEIFYARKPVATYLKSHPVLTRRALVNVHSLQGTRVTRNFPAKIPDDRDPGYKGEDGIIHPNMHPGIWIGFGDVSGNDFWRLKAKVEFDKFLEPPKATKRLVTFSARNLFKGESGKRIICEELTRYRFQKSDGGLLLLIEAQYRSDIHDFYFGDQEESGLGVRVASSLRVLGGKGTILNDKGDRNGSQVWGKPAKWCDYSGPIKGRQVGVMIAPSPDNFRPSWFHARDYGLLVANPFPKQPKERREPYVKTRVRKGEIKKLSWAILIYDFVQSENLDRDLAYQNMIKSLKR